MYALRFLACCLLLSAVGCSNAEKPKTNFTGLSGKVKTEAETDYSKARVLWTKRPGVPAGMETCSDTAKAIALLNSAITQEPKYADAFVRRGLAQSATGQSNAARADINTAVRLHPTAETYAYRALVSLRAKDTAAARKDLQLSLQKNESQFLAWNILGALEMLSGKKEAACQAYDEACSNGDCAARENAEKEKLCE